MELKSVRALRGPNLWAQVTVLEITLDMGTELPTQLAAVEAYRARLLSRLGTAGQSLAADADGLATNCGLRAAELFVRAAIALQAAAGCAVTFGRVAETREAGVFRLAVQYCEEKVGRSAVEWAFELCRAALLDQPYDTESRIRDLRRMDQNVRLGPSTGSIVKAAVDRGIPYRRLNTRSLVQLGYGSKQHRILAAETDRTSAVAEAIVQDKELTKELLAAIGVPVPVGSVVQTADEAWEAAQSIGAPVVIKPLDGNQGRGVAVNLHTEEQVRRAFAAAKEVRDDIIVEKFAPGADYRLLIIDNKLVAAARREPPQVTGDGRRSIEQLVQEVNLDPRRGEDHATSLSKIPIDEIAVAVLIEQGLTPLSVPAAGQLVLLRRNANLSTGGSAADVTELVHPEVAARAIEGARMVGLDIAGVDIVCSDISRPLEQQGGVIVEINAAPGLRMHLEPSSGKARPVGESIVSMMFRGNDSGRIPIVAVTGTNGKTTTTRLIAHMLRSQGKAVGMTCTDGVYINDRRVDTGDCSGPRSARTVLGNPVVDAAVLETARGGILREGLGFDYSDVSVVTNIADGDHLGMNGIETPEQLARVKRVVLENVGAQGYGVLNAADPLTAAMAEFCPGKVIFFALSADEPVLAAHRAKGGRVAYVSQNAIYVAEGQWEVKVASLTQAPLTLGGRIGFQVENTLAAVAASWGLGIPFEAIRAALETFTSDTRRAPARFNVIEVNGATVVVDYGHNTAALQALVQAFDTMPHQRRLIVYTAAGDRRDEDIINQAKVIAEHFDQMVIYEDQCTRGRADGEVIRLMKMGLEQGRRLKQLHETRGEMTAIQMTLDLMQTGDLVLVQADQVDEALAFVQEYLTTLSLKRPVTRVESPSKLPAR